jgi:LuxR family transcriptional regulator, maltose regulon positive regulatory protein
MVPVVATRLRPPTRAGAAVPREVLPTALAHLLARRLLLVRAPAGYGKSLLMAQLYDALRASGHESIAWLNVADVGSSLHEVTLHCATALARTVDGLHTALQVLFEAHSNASPETISALLCNELERVTGDLYLFLDDLHVLANSPAERFVECMLRDAPESLHFSIATRTEPNFSVARLRARGDLGEVDAQALRFSRKEAQLFFENIHSTLPSAQLIDLAYTKTEGWPAGLQLLSLSVGINGDWEERLGRLSGGNRSVGTFLAEEVFSGQSERVQRFLIQSAVLRQFNAALCDDVGQCDDSRTIIEQLQRQGLFIFSLDEDGQWFRYHHLFSQFLEKRLGETDPSLMSTLHRRATQWFRANSMLDDAMFHAFASRDFRCAADILDEACNDLFYQGQLLSLMAWVKQIPERILNEHPRIQLIRAWNLLLEWRIEETASVLASVIKRIRMQVDNGQLPPEEASRLHRVYEHRRMMLAVKTDDMRTVERMCMELLIDFPEDDPYLRGSIELSLLYAQRESYRLDNLHRLDAAARGYFERAKSLFILIWHESIAGPAFLQHGEVTRAEQGYRSAITIADGIAGHGSPLAAMPALLLAELEMERGAYDDAKVLWDRYLPVCEELGIVESLIAAYVGRARLAAVYSEYDHAGRLLSHATELAEAKSLDRLFWHATAERIRQAMLRNDLSAATRIANEAKLPRDATALYPTEQTTTKTEAMAVAWIRLSLVRGFAKDAEALARRWHVFALQRSCNRTGIRMSVLIAASRLVADDHRGAARALIDSLAQAAPCGIVLPFLEEGEAVKQTVATIFGLPADTQSDTEFSASLLEAYRTQPDTILLRTGMAPQRPVQPPLMGDGGLSQREIDILEFVSLGFQNKEIGDRLGLAEGTVKWYMQQIYSKLGVRRRLKAFQKAKALGWIR